jgi:hypothetical protein
VCTLHCQPRVEEPIGGHQPCQHRHSGRRRLLPATPSSTRSASLNSRRRGVRVRPPATPTH